MVETQGLVSFGIVVGMLVVVVLAAVREIHLAEERRLEQGDRPERPPREEAFDWKGLARETRDENRYGDRDAEARFYDREANDGR